MLQSKNESINSKAWPFEEARKIERRLKGKVPEKGYVLFQTGYGPSGLPHIGTFGEVMRTSMVKRAFEEISDIPTKLICFSDDMDGLRKIPSNIPNAHILETDLNLLQNEIDFLKRSISYKYKKENIKIYGSILIPSKQFIARFKFRPWKEVYIGREYLYSLEEFNNFTKDLFCLYINNNIIPVIETEFSKQDLFNNINNFVNK